MFARLAPVVPDPAVLSTLVLDQLSSHCTASLLHQARTVPPPALECGMDEGLCAGTPGLSYHPAGAGMAHGHTGKSRSGLMQVFGPVRARSSKRRAIEQQAGEFRLPAAPATSQQGRASVSLMTLSDRVPAAAAAPDLLHGQASPPAACGGDPAVRVGEFRLTEHRLGGLGSGAARLPEFRV